MKPSFSFFIFTVCLFGFDVHCASTFQTIAKPIGSFLFNSIHVPRALNIESFKKRFIFCPTYRAPQQHIAESILRNQYKQKMAGQGSRYLFHTTQNMASANKNDSGLSSMLLHQNGCMRQPAKWQLMIIPVGIVSLALYKMYAEQKEAGQLEFDKQSPESKKVEIVQAIEPSKNEELAVVKTVIKKTEEFYESTAPTWNWKHMCIGLPIGAGLWILIKIVTGGLDK